MFVTLGYDDHIELAYERTMLFRPQVKEPIKKVLTVAGAALSG
ncbi:MAG: hypothetical protein WDN48_15175 [Pseudolabrys sp.]